MRYKWLILIMIWMSVSACGGTSAARLNNEGNEKFQEGEYDQALEDYTSAKQEDPNLIEPYYNSGNALHRKEDWEGSSQQLRLAQRNAEDESLKQHSFYNMGNTHFQAEDWPAAIEAYKQALLIDPDDVDAKYNLELALKQLQEEQQQQQQQQQQQGGGGGEQQQEEGGDQGSQPPPQQEGEGEGDQQQDGGGGEGGEEEQPGGSGSQPNEQQGPTELSPEDAEQLLDALGQDSQTLQERLQEQYGAPAPPPEQDW